MMDTTRGGFRLIDACQDRSLTGALASCNALPQSAYNYGRPSAGALSRLPAHAGLANVSRPTPYHRWLRFVGSS